MMAVMHMRVHGQTQRGSRQMAARRLSGHLKYLEQGGAGLFSANGDKVPRRVALDDVLKHTASRVQYHRLVLAPDPEVRVPDLCAWTRAVLDDLANEQGKALHWYAVIHLQRGQPHVHVVLAGAGKNYATGQREPVRLSATEYEQLTVSGCLHSDEVLLVLPDNTASEVNQ